MAIYRKLWAASGILVLIAGLLLAIINVPAANLAIVAASSAFVAGFVRLTMKNGSVVKELNLRGYLTLALISAITGPGLLGWISTIGGYGVLLALVLASSAPVVVTWLQRQFPPPPDQPSAADFSIGPSIETILPVYSFIAIDLRTASDEAVIAAWRRSFKALTQATSPAERIAIAENRCQCLNEIERRFPDGFHKWIHDGARAASDPSKYLRPTSTVDPDE